MPRRVTILLLLILVLCVVPIHAEAPEPIVHFPDGHTGGMIELRAHYGMGITWTPSSGKHWALTDIIITEGPTLIKVWIRDENGVPVFGQKVTYSYPDPGAPSGELADLTGGGIKTLCSTRGVNNKNTTDGSGYVDFQIGSGSWQRYGQGPYTVWPLSTSYPSDCISYLGWVGGTDHQGPMGLVFRLTDDTLPTPSPTPIATSTPGPIPTPGTGDLKETNELLGQILALLQDVFNR